MRGRMRGRMQSLGTGELECVPTNLVLRAPEKQAAEQAVKGKWPCSVGSGQLPIRSAAALATSRAWQTHSGEHGNGKPPAPLPPSTGTTATCAGRHPHRRHSAAAGHHCTAHLGGVLGHAGFSGRQHGRHSGSRTWWWTRHAQGRCSRSRTLSCQCCLGAQWAPLRLDCSDR